MERHLLKMTSIAIAFTEVIAPNRTRSQSSILRPKLQRESRSRRRSHVPHVSSDIPIKLPNFAQLYRGIAPNRTHEHPTNGSVDQMPGELRQNPVLLKLRYPGTASLPPSFQLGGIGRQPIQGFGQGFCLVGGHVAPEASFGDGAG